MSIVPTFTVSNTAGASQRLVELIVEAAREAFRQWSAVLAGEANLSVSIDIVSTLENGRGNGGWGNGTSLGIFDGLNLSVGAPAFELATGLNVSGPESDVRLQFQLSYLLDELFIDDTPQTRNDIPLDRTELISVLMHEIGHAIAFTGYFDEQRKIQTGGFATPFDLNILVVGSDLFLVGKNAMSVYGGPVPLTRNNYTHYGNNIIRPEDEVLGGLMNGVIFFDGLSYGISDLDLAIIADTGLGTIRDDILSVRGQTNFRGGQGNDQISGSEVVNYIYGDEGNDLLDGDVGADFLFGGFGNDSYIVDDSGDLVFESVSEGTDSVSASTSHYLYANVENLTLTGSAPIFGVGNELANALTGNAGENLLIAGAGADTVRGGGARDAIFGEAGDDRLFGDAGVDYIVAGIGNDSVDGGVDADEIYGQEGDDLLNGGSSFHTDIIVGGDGNDVIRGDSGEGDFDFLYGNAGNDVFYVDTPADLVFEQTGEGSDTVFADINGAGFYLYDNIENLTLLGSTPFGVGNALANSITGNAQGNFLLGGAGNDVLNGMGGGDVLFGEAGADLFVFGRGTGGDVIGDFQRGVDRIDLTAFGIGSFAALQSMFVQDGNIGAILLGNGDLVVLHGVQMGQLVASDFTI